MLIALHRWGGLGNRLQLAAYAAAVALERGTTVVLLCLDGYADLFVGTSADALCRLPAPTTTAAVAGVGNRLARLGYAIGARLPGRLARLSCAVGAQLPGVRKLCARRYPGLMIEAPDVLADIDPRETLLLDGYYFYAPTLLARHAATIRAYFQLVPARAATVAGFLSTSRQRAPRTLVGVHIRHGDYATYRGGEHFFSVEQYVQVMHRTRDLVGPHGVHFVVCSDAPQPAHAFAELSWEPGPGSMIEDMYVLAGCDYIIGPVSSFNRWAAFMGEVPRHEIHDPGRPLTLDDFIEWDLTCPEPAATARD